jgi:RNA polymerase primary sigma factor
LYDTLLDEFEDDVSRVADDEDAFQKLPLDEIDDPLDDDLDDGNLEDAEAEPADGAAKVEEEEDILLSLGEDNESWSDDPVRMYLTQMGEIPLLTRQQEISLAKRIEVTRRRFRTKLLECDFVIQEAVKVLRRVHSGELPFDRTVQVSVTDRLEKDQILGRLPHNLRTLEILLKRNRRDYLLALSKSKPRQKRKEAWQRLARRRRRAVRLVEELGLRTQRIETRIRTLEEFTHRIDELRTKIAEHKRNRGSASERKPWVVELRNVLLATQETPSSVGSRPSSWSSCRDTLRTRDIVSTMCTGMRIVRL